MKKADKKFCELNNNERYEMAFLMNGLFDGCDKDRNVVSYARSSYFNKCTMTANEVIDFLVNA